MYFHSKPPFPPLELELPQERPHSPDELQHPLPGLPATILLPLHCPFPHAVIRIIVLKNTPAQWFSPANKRKPKLLLVE